MEAHVEWIVTALKTIGGIFFLRYCLYKKHWGHGGVFYKLAAAAAGIALIASLVNDNATIATVIVVLGILPYKQILLWHLERNVVKGLDRMARDWGVSVSRGPGAGLFQVVKDNADGIGPAMWVGNVITEWRSLHPGVKTSQKYFMLAFVVPLKKQPPFQCSITKGRTSPEYFETEWRRTETRMGEAIAMNIGSFFAGGGRTTGGKIADLSAYPRLTDTRFADYSVIGTEENEFLRVFDGELLDSFFAVDLLSLRFELNVTPTSVSIYAQYCLEKEQRKKMDFLQSLAVRLDSMT
jgi:hypothetical protein